MLYKEFLRHSCVTAHIGHKDLTIQNFTFSLKVPCVLSLFLSMRQRCNFNKVTRNIGLLI